MTSCRQVTVDGYVTTSPATANDVALSSLLRTTVLGGTRTTTSGGTTTGSGGAVAVSDGLIQQAVAATIGVPTRAVSYSPHVCCGDAAVLRVG